MYFFFNVKRKKSKKSYNRSRQLKRTGYSFIPLAMEL